MGLQAAAGISRKAPFLLYVTPDNIKNNRSVLSQYVYVFRVILRIIWGGDSVVVIVNRIRTGKYAARFPARARAFIFSRTSRPALELTQPSIQWVRGIVRGIKQLGSDVGNSPPPRFEVKDEWRYTSTPLYAFILNQYCSGDKIEKNEMGGACSTYGGEERLTHGFCGET